MPTNQEQAKQQSDRSEVVHLLTTYQKRVQKWFLLSAFVGAITGLFLAFYNWLVENIFSRLFLSENLWLYLLIPAVGLLLAWAIVKWLVPAGNPETTEAYVETYHSPTEGLRLRDLPGRMAATIATIASGGSMGLEGPAVYFGATTGSLVQSRSRDLFDPDETKILEVAGAAAGIAAIFKAPLTGVMFALEAPYRDDLVRRALVPALTAAATGYLVYTIFEGPGRLLQPDRSSLTTTYQVLLIAIALGIVCAIVARIFVYVLDWTQRLLGMLPGWGAAVVAGLGVGIMGVATFMMVDAPLTLGPGLVGTQLMIGQQIALKFLPFILVLKMLSTAFTAKGGGAGGMFFPLVFLGATIGSIASWILPTEATIYPIVGIAAMVGAGYRSPLAAVAFVAEATGSPGFVIPGLIAAATAQLAMGQHSISQHQLSHRWSGVESTLGRTVGNLIEDRPRPPVVDATTDLDTFAQKHLLAHRSRALPVIESNDCVGVIPVSNLTALERSEWKSHTVRDAMDPHPAILAPSDTIGQAAEELVQGDSDYAIVVDNGKPVGVLTAEDVVRLEEVLGAVSRRRPPQR